MGRVKAQNYRDLIAWQKSMDLAERIYEVTNSWPSHERFGLTDQIRRAAVSIPSNIAEGHGRLGPKEFCHHVSIAHGSLCEAETQVLLARRLNCLDEQTSETLLESTEEIGRILQGLIRSLR